jgi:hypothetical protein
MFTPLVPRTAICAFLLASLMLPGLTQAATLILENPAVFDLRMDPAIFAKEKLSLGDQIKLPSSFVNKELGGDVEKYRKLLGELTIDQCHIQGLAMNNKYLFVSCCFYPKTLKVLRAYVARAFLLRAPLKDILESKGDDVLTTASWKKAEITELIQDQSGESPRTWVLGHPSGMVYDPEERALLAARAVYEKEARGQFLFISPNSLQLKSGTQPILIPEHIGFAAPIKKRFWIGNIWGSEKFVIADSPSKQVSYKMVPNPIKYEKDSPFDIQDCEPWREDALLCGGNFGFKTKEKDENGKEVEWNVRKGALFLIEFDGDDLESIKIKTTTPIAMRDAQSQELTYIMGQRKYRYEEGKGDIEKIERDYAGYRTPYTLTNNGLALSPDKKFIYFLQNDIPKDKLIRFRLTAVADK